MDKTTFITALQKLVQIPAQTVNSWILAAESLSADQMSHALVQLQKIDTKLSAFEKEEQKLLSQMEMLVKTTDAKMKKAQATFLEKSEDTEGLSAQTMQRILS